MDHVNHFLETASKVLHNISYSRRDASRVQSVVKHIETAGYRVWIDTASTGGSARFAEPIVQAIDSAKVVAMMCSKNAFDSDHVVRELYVAGEFKKPFVAVLLDDTDLPHSFRYFLSGFPRLPVAQIAPDRVRSEIARYMTA